MRWMSTATVAWLVLFTAACGAPAERHAQTPEVATATAGRAVTATAQDASTPDRRVGAVFLGGETLHVCSGSVLHSQGGDLILTAAHCMSDDADEYFAPGYAESADTDDYWHIDAVYLDPRWIDHQDPLADFAIARVSRADGATVEAHVGGGLTLGSAPSAGTDVTVAGYAVGIGGEQLACRARTALHRGYPALPCAGLVDGTSGSPWLVDATVTGVVGGLEGGGCEESVSYSAPFDDAVQRLLERAEAGGPGDVPPSAFDDDC